METNIRVTTNTHNTVATIRRDGRQFVAVGSLAEHTVAEGTSLAFSRTSIDWDILYVTTSGGVSAPINGTITEPGKIIAVNTKGYYSVKVLLDIS